MSPVTAPSAPPVQAPDLTAIPLELLGDTALAHLISLYRQRLEQGGVPVGAFNSHI